MTATDSLFSDNLDRIRWTATNRDGNASFAAYPVAGDLVYLTSPGQEPGGGITIKIRVSRLESGQVVVRRDGSADTCKIPLASWSLFLADVQGRLEDASANSGDAAVDTVCRNVAQYLGRGDDGLVFRVGDLAVKVSTTVRLDPFRSDHRTPAEARDVARSEFSRLEKLQALGVPAVLPARKIEHAGRVFLVRPLVDLVEQLTPEQLRQVRASVEAMHRCGWAICDPIQVGEWRGKIYHYDLSKAKPKASAEEITTDNRRLARLVALNAPTAAVFAALDRDDLAATLAATPVARLRTLAAEMGLPKPASKRAAVAALERELTPMTVQFTLAAPLVATIKSKEKPMPAKQPIRRLQVLFSTPSMDGTIDALRITLRDQFGSQQEVEIPRSCAASSWKSLATVLKAKTGCQIDKPQGYIPGLPNSAQCGAANMSGRTLPPLAFQPVALTPTTTVPSAMPGVDRAVARHAAAHAKQIVEAAVRAHQMGATTSAQVHELRRQELLAATASGRAVLDAEAAARRGK